MGAQLQVARRSVRACNHSEQSVAARAAGRVRVPEIGMIESVEGIDLHGYLHPVMKPLALRKRDVRVVIAWAYGLIQPGVSNLIERRSGEAACVEPFRHLSQRLHRRTSGIGAIAHAVVQVVRCEMDRHGLPRLQYGDGADLPSAEQHLEGLGAMRHPLTASAKGKLVNETGDEVLRDVRRLFIPGSIVQAVLPGQRIEDIGVIKLL